MIAGPVAPVDAVIAAVSAQNRFARRVNMEVASHTALMDPILPELRAALADLTPEIATIPFFSTVAEAATAPLLDAEYWVANVRQPALLSQAITAAGTDHATFVEISAHPILTHADQRNAGVDGHHHSVGTLWRDGDDAVSFHTNLNTTHTSQPPQTAAPAASRIPCCPPLRGTTPATGSDTGLPVPRRLVERNGHRDAHAAGRFRRSGTASWPGRLAGCPPRTPA